MAFSKTGSDPISEGYEIDEPSKVDNERDVDTEHNAGDNEDGEKVAGRKRSVRRFRRVSQRDKRGDT